MSEREVKSVITRDRSSGKVHLRMYVNGRLLSDEADNLDDAGEWDEIGAIDEIPIENLCERCFPRDPGDG